jgi:hypothetical protein
MRSKVYQARYWYGRNTDLKIVIEFIVGKNFQDYWNMMWSEVKKGGLPWSMPSMCSLTLQSWCHRKRTPGHWSSACPRQTEPRSTVCQCLNHEKCYTDGAVLTAKVLTGMPLWMTSITGWSLVKTPAPNLMPSPRATVRHTPRTILSCNTRDVAAITFL